MLFNSVCNYTRNFVNHLYDYRPKWTSLSPITITYQVNTVLKVQVHACEENWRFNQRVCWRCSNFCPSVAIPLNIDVVRKTSVSRKKFCCCTCVTDTKMLNIS